jgi:hypothetical protein
LQNRELIKRLIEAVAHRTVARDFAELISLFPQKRDEREKIISQLAEFELALRDLLVVKKADTPTLTFFTEYEYVEELSYCISAQKITQIIALVENARLALLRNANIKLTLTNLLSSLI